MKLLLIRACFALSLIALNASLGAFAQSVAEITMYEGPDRPQRLIQGAKKEGSVVVERGDVAFYVHVALSKSEAGYTVRAVPHVVEQVLGSPRGRELTHDDADWPGWADGKADRIVGAIHERLKGCAAAPAG